MQTRTPVLVVIVGLLLAMMVGLNVAASRFVGGRDDEAAESKTEENKPATAQSPGAMEGAESLARISPSWTTGAKDAKDLVVIGWIWTPQVQADPSSVHAAITALRSVPARVRVVNVDAFPETPAGVSVNGKVVLPMGADGAMSPESAMYAVRSELSRGGGR